MAERKKKPLPKVDARCLRCHVVMDGGFVIDLSHHESPNVPQWAQGDPELGFLGGLKVDRLKKRIVATYRCPKCGMLQSYAP